jgi:hypothetical protein
MSERAMQNFTHAVDAMANKLLMFASNCFFVFSFKSSSIEDPLFLRGERIPL